MSKVHNIAPDKNAEGIARDLQTPAYAATIAITPNSHETVVVPGALTGNLTINLTTTSSQTGDKIIFCFTASGATRTVTLGTGLAGNPNKLMDIEDTDVHGLIAIFNGTTFGVVGDSFITT